MHSAKDRLARVERAIESQRNLITCLASDIRQPEILTRQISQLEKRIADDTAKLARLRYQLEHGQESLDSARDLLYARMAERDKLADQVQREEQIEKLKALAEQIQELQK